MVAFTIQNATTGNQERTVFSCDYNGWADVPEEEREGIDAFESSRSWAVTPVSVPVEIDVRLLSLHNLLERRAA
jgi:hypothetical protein